MQHLIKQILLQFHLKKEQVLFGRHFLNKYVNSAICDKFPLASFIATIFGIFESSKQVSGAMLTPVLLGTLYSIIGSQVLFAIAV